MSGEISLVLSAQPFVIAADSVQVAERAKRPVESPGARLRFKGFEATSGA